MSVETPENCTKKIWEPCPLHPNDCSSCKNAPHCQQKPTMTEHRDKLKSCRFYRSRGTLL
jgi:hypothetical protein